MGRRLIWKVKAKEFIVLLRKAGMPRLISIFSVLSLVVMNSPMAAGMSSESHGRSSPLECDGVHVTVVGGEPTDRSLVCEGARLAINFLDRMGLVSSSQIDVVLQQSLPEVETNSIGLYDLHTDRVLILTLVASRIAAEKNSAFLVPMEARIYQSFVAHEIAHAVASRLYHGRNSQLLAHEYMAYVTQLIVMDADVRAKVLDKFTHEPFKGLDEMSLLYYQMAPCAFGVKAYRHFLSLEDGPTFLRDILSGRIQLGGAGEEWW